MDKVRDIKEEFEIIFKFTPDNETDYIGVKIRTSDNVKLSDGDLENLILHSIHQVREDRYQKRMAEEKKNKKPSFFQKIKNRFK